MTAFVLLSLAGGVHAQEPSRSPDTQDIYLSFNYSGLVNTVVTALYDKDSVYVPIGTLFKELRVDYSLDLKARTMIGFYITPSVKYVVNFGTGEAEIGGRKIRFDTSKVIIGQLDFYLLPSVISEIFGLNFKADFGSLSLFLNTDLELPIVKDYQRESRKNYAVVSPDTNLIQAPLMYPRSRSLLNGGVVDYSLTATGTGGQPTYNYELDGGAEVLGGETEGNIYGTLSRTGSTINSNTFSWKYAFDSTGIITYAGLGNLYSGGLTQYGFRGAQISNEPLTVRTLFGQYAVDAKTNPGWDVELYLNGQLVGYKTADSLGRAEFKIPIVYGTSFVQLKYYGPNGEFHESDRRLQIPFSFLPAGQVTYSVSAGKIENSNQNFASAYLNFGLFDWASDKVGMDYLDNPLFGEPLFYNSLSLRFSPEYTMDIDAAPQAYYKSTFSALYASQAAWDMSYSRYNHNLLYNPGGKLQEADANAYMPFSFGGSDFNIRLAGTAEDYAGGERTYTYSSYLSTDLSQVNASLGYQRSITDFGPGTLIQNYSLSGNVLYSLFFQSDALSFLNGTLLNVTGRYGVLKNSLDDLSFQLSKNLQQYIRVAFTAERDYVNRSTSLSLQIIADLPFTRSTTNVQSQSTGTTYAENLSGSVGFDSNSGTLLFNDIGWVGHSAASMRMFVDANGNGRYDKGEEIIKEGQINLRQAVSIETSKDGTIRDWNLLPYTQYSADVDLSTIRNPLWIPKEKSFSFITDPNSYKRVDVPFYAGGIVDGTVLREQGGVLSAIAGLTLEIKSLSGGKDRSVNVFNDGSFYYMGLPPGDYEAYVDPTQLRVLEVVSDPPSLHFTVKPSIDGDFVEGLKMVLKTPSAVLPPHPKVGSAAAEARPSAETSNRKYLVQLGAFNTRDKASKFAKWARILSGQIVESRYNRSTGLFVVQTDSLDSRETALHRLDIFVNKFGLSDAFIVSPADSTPRYLFSVQLGAFQSIEAAKSFASKVGKEYQLTPIVQFKKSNGLFAVMVGPYASEFEADSIVSHLRKFPDCRGAFALVYGERDIPLLYIIELGSFRTEESAKWFARTFRWRTGMLAILRFDRKTLMFDVTTRTFTTDEEATGTLEKIRSYGDYSSARIMPLQ